MEPDPAVDGDAPGALLCDRLLLAVTGSPAALSMPQYVLMMRQTLVSEVRVVMSRAAQQFVRPYTMRLAAGSWVHTDGPAGDGLLIPHVELTQDVDLVLVMPATANVIGKAAHGICDELVSSAIVASPAPVAFVPAMSGTMWGNRAVQRNVRLARRLGYHVVEPGIGVQIADTKESASAMPPLEHILDELISLVRSPAGVPA